MKLFKHQTVRINGNVDLTSTGGPFIPDGTLATVLIRRRDGRVCVNIRDFDQRRVYPNDLKSV